jgi:hypothetical protein
LAFYQTAARITCCIASKAEIVELKCLKSIVTSKLQPHKCSDKVNMGYAK